MLPQSPTPQIVACSQTFRAPLKCRKEKTLGYEKHRNVDAKHRIGKCRNFDEMDIWISHTKNIRIL
jgi:hypothetical protein